jgi:hypothetical protein
MSKVKIGMVLAVAQAMAKARNEARDARPEVLATAWAMSLQRWKRGVTA